MRHGDGFAGEDRYAGQDVVVADGQAAGEAGRGVGIFPAGSAFSRPGAALTRFLITSLAFLPPACGIGLGSDLPDPLSFARIVAQPPKTSLQAR